jgi:O-antigen/teichoic acid export membrane protein
MSIGKSTAVGLATDISVFGLGILVSVVLRRSLGPEQSGVYVLLTTTNVFVASIAHLSLEIACSTLLARGRYRLGEVNAFAMIMALALGTLSLAITSIAYAFLHDSVFQDVPYIYVLVALLLVPITIYQIYWNYMMMGLNRVITLNKLTLMVNVTSAFLMIIVVGVLHLGIPGFLAVWSLSALAGAAGSLVFAARIERLKWLPDKRLLSDMLSFGLRSHGRNIAHQLFLRFDMYSINVVLGATGVGLYSLSTSLAEKLWLPLNAIHASSLSKITQLPREESAILTAKVARTGLLMMLSMAIPFAIVSPWLIPFLYGQEFSASVLPLVILLGGTLGFAVMLVLNNYILGRMERPGLLSIITWLQLVVSIPLYLVLILWLGIVGAAIASTLTYLLAMASTIYIFTRDSGLHAHMVLVPRRADFQDYVRVLKRIRSRLPV